MENIKGFKNSLILTETGIIKTSLLIKDGLIDKIGDFECDGLIELDEDKIIVPGFIDEHIHGANGSTIMDGTIKDLNNIAVSLAQEGVTTFLATTDTQCNEVICKALETVKKYIEENHQEGAEIIGVHLEGPFLARKYAGAMVPEYLTKPSIDSYKAFEEVCGDTIKLVTLAIEEEGAKELINYLKSKNITISIGHSNATHEEIKGAIKNGVTSITHTYNAMRPLRRNEIGMVGSTLLCDELYCEAICDGVHSSIPAIQLLWKNKPKDKFILITDALSVKFLPDGKYLDVDQILIKKEKEARLENGKLAGSVLQMNQAVKNLIDFVNADFIDSIKCATENPAKNLKVFDKMGSIKEGKLANLAIVDKNVNVYQTIRNGNVIFTSPLYK